jgi:hypothetical protein
MARPAIARGDVSTFHARHPPGAPPDARDSDSRRAWGPARVRVPCARLPGLPAASTLTRRTKEQRHGKQPMDT